MPVPAGTATPWREIEDPSSPGGSSISYFRPGTQPGPPDFLAEQLRVDGIVTSIGTGIRAALGAKPKSCWYGLDDDEDHDVKLCDADGWTHDGRMLVNVGPCVVVTVDRDEV